jgi:hypothetical protein
MLNFVQVLTPVWCYLVLLSIVSSTGFAYFCIHPDFNTSRIDGRFSGLNSNIDLISIKKSYFSCSPISAIFNSLRDSRIEYSIHSSSSCLPSH